MKTFELIISGRVQGVGYRNYANKLANKFNIFGTVRNLSNGDVKVIVQTTEIILDKYVKSLKRPQHPFMRIDDISIREISSQKVYDSFAVIY